MASYRKHSRDIWAMLTASIKIVPDCNPTNLNKAVSNELFPAPVRPTTPIFSAGRVSNVTPFKAGAKWSRYFITTLLNETTPWLGHAYGGSTTTLFFSGSTCSIYWLTRSTAIISRSVSVNALITPPSNDVTDNAYDIARPISPGLATSNWCWITANSPTPVTIATPISCNRMPSHCDAAELANCAFWFASMLSSLSRLNLWVARNARIVERPKKSYVFEIRLIKGLRLFKAVSATVRTTKLILFRCTSLFDSLNRAENSGKHSIKKNNFNNLLTNFNRNLNFRQQIFLHFPFTFTKILTSQEALEKNYYTICNVLPCNVSLKWL